jgi:hypothetical protein
MRMRSESQGRRKRRRYGADEKSMIDSVGTERDRSPGSHYCEG